MATTTATITLNSADITGDALSLNKSATLTKANSNTGLDQFTGITTVIYAAAQTAKKLLMQEIMQIQRYLIRFI